MRIGLVIGFIRARRWIRPRVRRARRGPTRRSDRSLRRAAASRGRPRRSGRAAACRARGRGSRRGGAAPNGRAGSSGTTHSRLPVTPGAKRASGPRSERSRIVASAQKISQPKRSVPACSVMSISCETSGPAREAVGRRTRGPRCRVARCVPSFRRRSREELGDRRRNGRDVAEQEAQHVHAVHAELQHHAAPDLVAREEPRVPVRPRRRVAHPRREHRPGRAAGEELGRALHLLEVAVHEAHLEEDAAAVAPPPRMRRHSALERPIGFCSSTAFPAVRRRARDLAVRVVGRRDHHRVDVAPVEDRAPVGRDLRDREPAGDLGGALPRARGDDADRRATRGREPAEMVVGDRAGAEEPDADRVGGRSARSRLPPAAHLHQRGVDALQRIGVRVVEHVDAFRGCARPTRGTRWSAPCPPRTPRRRRD